MKPNTAKAVRSAAKSTVEALHIAQQAGGPLQVGHAREAALMEGISAIARAAGASIEKPYCIDARGDIAVIGTRDRMGASTAYGQDFADLLSAVPRRTGSAPTSTPAYATDGWCYVNHFDVERLVRLIAEGKHPALARNAPEKANDGPAP